MSLAIKGTVSPPLAGAQLLQRCSRGSRDGTTQQAQRWLCQPPPSPAGALLAEDTVGVAEAEVTFRRVAWPRPRCVGESALRMRRDSLRRSVPAPKGPSALHNARNRTSPVDRPSAYHRPKAACAGDWREALKSTANLRLSVLETHLRSQLGVVWKFWRNCCSRVPAARAVHTS